MRIDNSARTGDGDPSGRGLPQEILDELVSLRGKEPLKPLSEYTKTSQQFLSNVFNGRRPPSPQLLDAILAFYECSPDKRGDLVLRWLRLREPALNRLLHDRVLAPTRGRVAAGGSVVPQQSDARGAGETQVTMFGSNLRIQGDTQAVEVLKTAAESLDRALRTLAGSESLKTENYRVFVESKTRQIVDLLHKERFEELAEVISCFLPDDVLDGLMATFQPEVNPSLEKQFQRFVREQEVPDVTHVDRVWLCNHMAWCLMELIRGNDHVGERELFALARRFVERARKILENTLSKNRDEIIRPAVIGLGEWQAEKRADGRMEPTVLHTSAALFAKARRLGLLSDEDWELARPRMISDRDKALEACKIASLATYHQHLEGEFARMLEQE